LLEHSLWTFILTDIPLAVVHNGIMYLHNPIVEYRCFYLSYLATAVQLTANGITHRPTQVFVYRSVAQKLGYVPRVPDFPGYPGRCWELPIFMEKTLY